MKTESNKKKHCFDIVFEWEDILSKELSSEILTRSPLEFSFDEKARKIYQKFRIPIYRLFQLADVKRGKNILMFDASTKRQDGIYNSFRYIPCIIDYFLDEKGYLQFLKAYKKNPLVLISSKEVYDALVEKKCPLNIDFFPLSIPDYYKTEVVYKKEYDLIIAGRINPLLAEYVEKYEKDYPKMQIIKRKYVDDHFVYFNSATGEDVGFGDSREEYNELLQKSKIALYTTPGMDETRTDANGWNQVTPRFLEEIVAQCHIIARYPKNADTDWYEMDKICHNIVSYEDFVETMIRYLVTEVDLDLYRSYLEKHYTSKRADLLKQIAGKNSIEL